MIFFNPRKFIYSKLKFKKKKKKELNAYIYIFNIKEILFINFK
jgi:hypothetical protein